MWAVGEDIYGRDVELALVRGELERVADGAEVVVAVEGAAGMGKSRLLAEVAVIARSLGIKVGGSAADPSETVVERRTTRGVVRRSRAAARPRQPYSGVGCVYFRLSISSEAFCAVGKNAIGCLSSIRASSGDRVVGPRLRNPPVLRRGRWPSHGTSVVSCK